MALVTASLHSCSRIAAAAFEGPGGLSVVPNDRFEHLCQLNRPRCERELLVSGVRRDHDCAGVLRALFSEAQGLSFLPGQGDRAVVRFDTEEAAR